MAITIDIGLKGQAGVNSGLGKVATNLDNIATKLDALNSKLANLNGVKISVRGIGSAASTAAGQVNQLALAVNRVKPPPVMKAFTTPPKMSPLMGGPNSRAASTGANLSRALQSGDPAAIADAQYLHGLAIKNQQKAFGGSDPMKRILSMISTTRLNLGGGGMGASPLIGRIGNMVGGAAGGGPIGAAFAIATAQVTAFAHVVGMAKDRLVEIGGARFASGAGSGSYSQMLATGGALGMGPSQYAGLARQVGDALAEDPLLRGFANKVGIDARPFPFGNMDDADKLNKLIAQLGDPNLTDEKTARIMSRKAGVDDQVSLLRNMSPGVRRDVLSPSQTGFSQDDITKAADAQGRWNKSMVEFTNVATKLGTEALPFLTASLKVATDLARGAGKGISAVAAPVRASMAGYAAAGIPGAIAGAISGAFSPSGSSNSAISGAKAAGHDAVRDNTAALNDLNRTLKERRATFGGGDRTRSYTTLPQGFTDNYLQNNDADAIRRQLGSGLG